MKIQTAGYNEIEHTADLELHIWAPDFMSLLKQAAGGMYALSGVQLAAGPRVSREFEIPFDDREALLVDFLSELLFYGENDNIGFDEYQLDFDATVLEVRADGALIEHHDKGIKAVTFHQLEIRPTERGLEVNIVFDV